MISETYHKKKILITGHTGFKGGWLALWLTRLGAEVTGYSIEPPSNPNLFETIGLEDRIHHIHGNVLDVEALAKTVERQSPEIIFHLAAQSIVLNSYENPRDTFQANVMGTVNLLEAIRGSKSVRAVVVVTSDKCYENTRSIWGYRETDRVGGDDPYSASKGCAELVLSSYLRSFFSPEQYQQHRVALASARAGNVIGGGDWGQDRLIPDCMRALAEENSPSIRNPDAQRPWQFVLEPLTGYLMLGARLFRDGVAFAGGWNFGPIDFDFWPVARIVDEMCRKWGHASSVAHHDAPEHEAALLRLDSSKAVSQLAWRPAYSVAQALETTFEWYRAFYNRGNRQDMLNLTLKQIEDYCAVSPCL